MKKSLFLLLGIAAMSGCTQSEVLDSRPDGNVVIELKSSALSVDALTRAPFEGEIGAANTLTAKVLASKTEGDFSTAYAEGTITFQDNGKTASGFADAKYYPFDDRLYFCGLYPADTWGAFTTTASFTFDGSDDVMAAGGASATKTEASASSPVLKFSHLLTLLTVKVVAADQPSIDAWGALTDITLTGAGGGKPFTTVAVKLSDGTAAANAYPSAFSGPADSFAFYQKGGDDAFTGQTTVLTTDVQEVAYSIVAPVVADGEEDFTLSVKTVERAEGVSVPVHLKQLGVTDAYTGTTQGKKFSITLKFKQTGINAAASVQKWEEAGQSDVEI